MLFPKNRQGAGRLSKLFQDGLVDKLYLVEARPLTGRTHQIRVHLASVGLPILGDTTYGGGEAGRMMLHCSAMTFQNLKNVEIVVTAPLDGEFEERVSKLQR